MLHSVLDDGNFVVIPESVVDVWAAESYSETHTKQKLRETNEFGEDDVIILVLGSSFFYDEFSWDNAVAMHMLGPLLTRYGRRKDNSGSFKFVFLYGNSTKGQSDAVQVKNILVSFNHINPSYMIRKYSFRNRCYPQRLIGLELKTKSSSYCLLI